MEVVEISKNQEMERPVTSTKSTQRPRLLLCWISEHDHPHRHEDMDDNLGSSITCILMQHAGPTT